MKTENHGSFKPFLNDFLHFGESLGSSRDIAAMLIFLEGNVGFPELQFWNLSFWKTFFFQSRVIQLGFYRLIWKVIWVLSARGALHHLN